MRIKQMLDNGQSQTQTRGVPGRASLGLAERLEHLRNEVPRNAFAGIGYDETSDCAGFGQADRDASCGRREFQSV